MRQQQLHVLAFCLFVLISASSSTTSETRGELQVSFQGHLFTSVEETIAAREKLAFESEELHQKLFQSMCLATKSEAISGWKLLACIKLQKEPNGGYGMVRLLLPADKTTTLYLVGVDFDAISSDHYDVMYHTHLPPLFPNDDIPTIVDMTSKHGSLPFRVYLSLSCPNNQYGPRCATFCQPITERHVCNRKTGDLGCVRGWSGPMCSKSVFLPRHVASQFVKSRPKRANSWHHAEELLADNIERECEEERCSREEAREAFEDDDLTEHYWSHYIDPNQCVPNPCLYATRCEDQLRDYVCHCKEGFRGKNCQFVIDVCESSPCQNGAVCSGISPTSFGCACPPGFRGPVCGIDIDDCVDSACSSHGVCRDGVNTYTCECDQGYTGLRCSDEIDECATAPCQNGGNCTDYLAYYNCTCPHEYHGTNCELRHSPCRSLPCQNGGLCFASHDYNYVCVCRPEFTGDDCQHKVGSPCASEPCNNDGSCYVIRNNVTNEVADLNVSKSLEFGCLCPMGYGGRTCDKEISACEYADFPCPLNSTCVSLSLQYVCVCPVGFTGEFCHVPGNDSEAVARLNCADDPCLNEARCIFNDNRITCVCRPGYNGTHCENEMNFCASDPCIHGGECIRKPGDFYCNCAEGYHGRYCENDIDECSTKQMCHNNVTCNNTIGSFQCLCGPYLTGRLCEFEFDPCGSTPCQRGGTCYHGEDGYECHCLSGYGGRDCQDIIDPCDWMINPCINNGTCAPLADDPTQANCSCGLEFYGRYCDKVVDHCVVPGNETRYDPVSETNVSIPVPRSECGKNGDCVSEKFGFRCQCHAGYVGERCDVAFTTPVVNCTSELCKCPKKLLKNLKADRNVTSVPCQYKHYEQGVCAPPTCVTPPCGQLQASRFCKWKSTCLWRYTNRYNSKELKHNEVIGCQVLELVFNGSRLGNVMTIEILCHALRQLSAVTRFKGVVTLHCGLLEETSENVTMATALDSITSEDSAFVLASNLFLRLEEDMGSNRDNNPSATDRDPFFSRTLLQVRFGHYMGHDRFLTERLVNPDPTAQNHKNVVEIAVPIALGLLLFLLVLFFLMRRRHKKALQINLYRDPNHVGDVIGATDSGSVDGVVVLPTKALWSKMRWGKNKKKRHASDSFDNPLFNEPTNRGLTSRPSVVSNAYVGATSPMISRSNDDVTKNSVEKSTIAYSVHSSPSHSSSQGGQDNYTNGDTIPHGVINLPHPNPSPSKSSQSSVKMDPYSTIADNPYSVAIEPASTSKMLDPKELYSFAEDPNSMNNAFPNKTPIKNNEITRPVSTSTTPVRSPGNFPRSSPVKVSSATNETTGNRVDVSGESAASSSGKEKVNTTDTRWSSGEEREHYQSPPSLFPENDLFFTERQTELPELYNVPRKANPVD